MKKLLTVSLFALIIVSMSVGAFANGLSLNSVGIKALSMGGAFVGQADDITAIYWNPAGLANQGSGVQAFGVDIMPIGSYKADGTDFGVPAEYITIDADMKSNHYPSPNIFINHRVDKLALSFGIYIPAGLGAEYDGKDLLALSQGVEQEWMSKIGVINFSPAIAYDFERFQIGAAMNIMYGMFDIKRPANYDSDGDMVHDTSSQYEESSTGLGYGVSVSGLFHVNEMLSFGANLRTKSNVKMKGEAENPAMAAAGAAKTDFDRDVSWPTWIGAGVSFKPNEKLTVNADIQYSAWEDSEDRFKTEFDNAAWAAATAATGDDTFVLEWEDAIQYRLGMEYMVKPCVAMRAGYYYDPAPAPDERINILFPSSTNHTATYGIGWSKDQLSIDFGLEYLFGAEREVEAYYENPDPNNPSPENMPGLHQMDIFAFGLGVTYRY